MYKKELSRIFKALQQDVLNAQWVVLHSETLKFGSDESGCLLTLSYHRNSCGRIARLCDSLSLYSRSN